MYAEYCAKITMAINKIEELTGQSKSFSTLLDRILKESNQRFLLKDLLPVPMQRIVRYPLLIKDMVK